MNPIGTSSSDSISTIARNNQGVGQTDLGRDEFLDLFVAQLQNQDPLDPVKNEDFVAQLASISSVEQLESLNSNVVASIALNQNNALLSQLTSSSSLIGKTVNFVDQSTGLQSNGTVDGVKIENGVAVLNIGGRDIPLGSVTEILGEYDGGDESVDDSTDSDSDTEEQDN
jgi:flagellar basal-body rod modification protein FlgD